MASCFAFHSYKAGMGKITIAANLPVLLLSSKIGMEMNSFIIYFCGIQFNQKGILESSFPNHLFEKGFYIK